MPLTWRIKFEPRDLWVGLFWDRKGSTLHLYFCPVPTLLLHIEYKSSPEPTWNPRTRARVYDAMTGEQVWVVLDKQGHHPWRTCPCFGCGQLRRYL